jgi:hypothetical protein
VRYQDGTVDAGAVVQGAVEVPAPLATATVISSNLAKTGVRPEDSLLAGAAVGLLELGARTLGQSWARALLRGY